MKIAIVGTVGVPACYGGFETLVDNLLDVDGENYTVYCSSKSYESRAESYKKARLVYIPLNANGVSSVFYDVVSLMHAVFTGHHAILVLGVSAGLILPLLKMISRRRLITNIDGVEWRREKWSKLARWYLKLSESAAVKYSDVVLADNQGIADYVQGEYGVKASVIAYGGDHALVGNCSGGNDGYALGICRVEPENNVHLILSAFCQMDMNLKFVGNWEASEYGKDLKKRFRTFANIEIIDPVYDIDYLFNLRDRCTLYVHGHSAGGTNPSLVEIMFFGKPIIAYDCIYNRSTMEHEGCYFSSSEELKEKINSIRFEELAAVGGRLLGIAQRRYKWSDIRKLYRNTLSGA